MPRTHQFRRLLLLWGATALCLFLGSSISAAGARINRIKRHIRMISTGNPAHRTKPRAKRRRSCLSLTCRFSISRAGRYISTAIW